MGIVSICKRLLKRDHTYVSGSSIHWFGTGYGGFYLDRSLLTPSSILLSFGVGEDISFDLSVGKQGIRSIFLFDPTPKSIDFIKGIRLPGNFHFNAIGISDRDEHADFFLPRNDDNVSGSLEVHKKLDSDKFISVQLKRLSTIVSEFNVQQIDVLKIDIEGSEYKVLGNIMSEGVFPLQICVEFHNEFYENGKKMFKETLRQLEENGYVARAVSKSGKEYLFVRNQLDQ